jgi:hypothetical protein
VTQTEQWVNDTCERIVAGGAIWLYKDLYKDLRRTLPCAEACWLIHEALHRTRLSMILAGVSMPWRPIGERTRACAALLRLARYANLAEFGQVMGVYGLKDRGL